MLKRGKQTILRHCYPTGYKLLGVFGKIVGIKPRLSCFEYHLADHCNLNCRGCSHFSPIAEKRFPDLSEYERDLRQLQRLFSTVDKIVLMGGEPLLNPAIDSFLLMTRSCFPETKIQILTNGILLPQMPETFWNACRSCSVDIAVTIYPPLKEKESALIQLVNAKGLRVVTHSESSFYAFFNKRGDTDEKAAFKRCRDRWNTPMLREGKIYICHNTATLSHFNKKFGLDIPIAGFVDIYSYGLDGWDIRDRLNKASSTCRYCALGWPVLSEFSWGTSKLALREWDAQINQTREKTSSVPVKDI